MPQSYPIGLAVILGLLAGACGDDMSPANQVVDLRVLAIRADPPEVKAPEDDGFAITTVDALVVGGEGEISQTWALCFIPGPVVNGMMCLDPEAEVALGEGQTATIPVPSPSLLLSQAPPEFQGFEIDLSEGVQVQVQLDVSDETGRALTALKQVTVSDREVSNTNPVLEGISFNETLWEEGQVVPLNQAVEEVEIVPQWDAITQEAYNDQGVEVVESLLFSWFIDDPASELTKQRSSDVAPGNVFSPGELVEGETERLVTLWLVARDDRGGVTWLSRQLRIVQGE